MIRRAWSRFVRKQWLFLYPVALAIIDTLAFLAVYVAADGPLRWAEFFAANFERGAYIHDHFLTSFQLNSALGIAVFAGVASCLFSALLLAPMFHAIAGPGYPLSPRRFSEAANLFAFYLLLNAVLGVAPLLATSEGGLTNVVGAAVWVALMVVAFADYVIVFENVGVFPAIRRSLQLLRHGWIGVLGLSVVVNFVAQGLLRLYHHFYDGQTHIFAFLPIAQVLVDSIVFLFANLALIFLYEDLRRRSPAG